MKEQLIQIPKLTTFNHALVEAGHFYGNSELDELEIMGVEIGIDTVNALKNIGIRVTPVVLVDNFHADDEYTSSNLERMQTLGYVPEVVYEEQKFEDDAWELFDVLKKKNKVKTRTSGTQNLRAENVPQLVSSDGVLSCSILDAAIYKRKHAEFGGICVTILPEEDADRNYVRQQSYTRAILTAADISIPILNVFYSDEGNIHVDFDY